MGSSPDCTHCQSMEHFFLIRLLKAVYLLYSGSETWSLMPLSHVFQLALNPQYMWGWPWMSESYRHPLPYLVYFVLGIKLRTKCMLVRHWTEFLLFLPHLTGSLSSLGYPWTCNSPASTSQALESQLHATKSSSFICYLYMCFACMYICAHVPGYEWTSEEGIRSLGTVIVDSCEQHVGSKNQTQVLWKII